VRELQRRETAPKVTPSEVHGALRRLHQSRLSHGSERQAQPNLSALEEFLLHGLKYAFPAERGEVTRGVPTSYVAEPLKNEISPSRDLPPAWPWPEGDTRGVGFAPLYKSAPMAALRDPRLYEFLALADAIRDGRARERNLGERELVKRLGAVRGKS
jgi:hypothetical protein